MKWFDPFSWIRNYRHSVRLKARAASRMQEPEELSRSSILVRVWVLLAVWLAVTACILFRPPRQAITPQVGREAYATVVAEQAFVCGDAMQTARDRAAAARQIPPVFRIAPDAMRETADCLALLRLALVPAGTRAAPAASSEPAAAVQEAVRMVVGRLNPRQREALEYVALSAGRWEKLEWQVRLVAGRGVASEADASSHFNGMAPDCAFVHVCDEAYRKRICPWADLLTPFQAAKEAVAAFHRLQTPGSAAEADVLADALGRVIRPNLAYDAVMTADARVAAEAQIPAVRTHIPAGTELLRAGQMVRPEDLDRLESYWAQTQPQGGVAANGLLFSLLFLLVLLCGVYFLHAIHPEAVVRNTDVLLIGMVMIMQIALNRFAATWFGEWTALGALALPALLPLSFGAMLLANLIGLRAALWVGCLTSFGTALQFATPAVAGAAPRFDEPFMLFVAGAVASFVAAALMRRSRRRYHAVRTGLGVGLVTAAVALIFLLCMHVPMENAWKPLLLAAFGNGIASALLAAYVMPIFEYLFGVTTDMTLLELSDLNHPLLKRLQMEAPGTYHHSLMVATLAEECASAVGANPLLARVCAYFHDIGKLVSPEYFTENGSEDNPHEDLRPSLSHLVILNHVKCGLELAAKHKLQRPIREAIAQHHGTSLVYFFYRRAVEQREDEDPESPPVGEHDYRYPGPLPVRKEIVIMSLADSCEAASRSLAKPTPHRIRAQVEELILKRIQDGQLDDADLTFSELAVVKETIIKSLSTMMHSRVRYPKEEEDDDVEGEAEQPKRGGGPGAQPPGNGAVSGAAG